jgi:hypothetical protein
MRRCVQLLVVLLAAGCATAALADDPKLDRLIVYGHGFALGVKEPPGWTGDTDSAAAAGANIVFYRKRETYASALALIRVRVSRKVDENTAGDLEYDANEYRRGVPDLDTAGLEVSHPSYRVFSRTFFSKKRFYDYVAYLNPGPGVPTLLSVSMYKKGKAGSAEELEAYQAVLKSVVLLPVGRK